MLHSTNYYNTLIEIAEDSKFKTGTIPPVKIDKPSIANLQFDKLFDHPYKFTSDEVLFGVYAERKGFDESELQRERESYFSKGQPCFRASPLTKSYGWGVHSDSKGRIAIFSADSAEYDQLVKDDTIKKVKAMRSKRK